MTSTHLDTTAQIKKAEEEEDIKTNRIWLALEAELKLDTAGSELEQAKALLAEKDEMLAQERAEKDKERAEKEPSRSRKACCRG